MTRMNGQGAVFLHSIGSCSLQLSWLPIACFATHADWTELPLYALAPVLAFLLAFTLVCGVLCCCFLGRIIVGKPRWLALVQLLMTVIGALLLCLREPHAQDYGALTLLSFILLGAGSALQAILCERALLGCDRKKVATAVVAFVAVASCGYAASASCSLTLTCIVAMVSSLAFALLWDAAEEPEVEAGVTRSHLLDLELRRLFGRCFATFCLLGICSSIMLGIFVSGIPSPLEFQVANFAPLGIVALLIGLALGWFPKKEFDFMLTFAFLVILAVVAFFPIDPGSKFNQHFALICGEIWLVTLVGNVFLVADVLDSLCARIGKSSIGLLLSGVFSGLSLGAAFVYAVSKMFWYGEVMRNTGEGVVVATSCGAVTLVLSYICTNLMVNTKILRNVELVAKGRIVSSLPLFSASLTKEKTAEKTLSNADIAARCRDVALEKGLTPREYEVLVVLAYGNSLARVQSELVISEGTAITHRRNIYRKLAVHSKQELLDFIQGERRASSGSQP